MGFFGFALGGHGSSGNINMMYNIYIYIERERDRFV